MKYHLYQLFALLAIVTLLFSCGKEEPTQPKIVSVTGITLDCSSMTMSIGEEHTLTASLSPDNATNKKVKWSSSNSSVVTVDEGKIKAIDEGEATITATTEDGGKTAICKITVSKPYFSFNTVNDTETNSLSIFALKANLQYSYDGKTWNDCEEDKEMEFGDGKTLMIQGVDNNVGNEPLCRFYFTKETKVECSGNIMYLLDCKHQETVIKRSYCFSGMFYGCNSLTKAPELPATQLAEHCYKRMFEYCSSLTEAPALPATQLAEHCYERMFEYCFSLTEAPALPATQLAESCYSSMFEYCTILTDASELPATQLAPRCYERMFYCCFSLTKAPTLPATQLAESCYSMMFYCCSSLIEAPVLPATQLAESCYSMMFCSCNSLKEAPALPATQLTEYCYEDMFSYCTSLTEAPALPATQLAQRCYAVMFSGCKSLTNAPALPATQLAKSCYSRMFNGCESLKKVKAMFLSYTSHEVYEMLSGVSPTGLFIKNKAAIWDNDGVIPSGWTVELTED